MQDNTTDSFLKQKHYYSHSNTCPGKKNKGSIEYKTPPAQGG